MPVVFLIAVVAVLAGVFFAATGRGGELAYEQADHAPLDLGPVSAPDVALLRPPTALWGYNMQVTDEALDHIARAMRDRDITIAYLQEQLANREPADVGASQALAPPTAPDAFQVFVPPTAPDAFQALVPPTAPDAFQALVPPTAPDAFQALADPADTDAPQPSAVPGDAPQPLRFLKPPGILVAPRPHETTQPSEFSQPYEATEPHEATQPSDTLPASDDMQGPQGSYDTHDWWAEQEEAAHEEARRQADAQKADQIPPGEASALEAGALEASALEASAYTASAPGVGGHPEEPADQAYSPSGRTGTLPNPTMTSPSVTDMSSGDADHPSAGSSGPVTPDDDGLAAAEEQAW